MSYHGFRKLLPAFLLNFVVTWSVILNLTLALNRCSAGLCISWRRLLPRIAVSVALACISVVGSLAFICRTNIVVAIL